ncbi:hypothetical protein LIER_00439 [Lithospermum erythrorhizon]|uniref:DEP domain-containing protein n=1 Tax=Lithospermum erythrorhizon TaxID=34254 RepID=A0AAV3NHW0_LITER
MELEKENDIKNVEQSDKLNTLNATTSDEDWQLNDNDSPPLVVQPNPLLPKPEVPKGMINPPISSSKSAKITSRIPSFKKFILDKSQSLSSAITNRFSNEADFGKITEIRLSDVKVIVNFDRNEERFRGRVSFYSRSNCRDCTAVRRFLRDRKLNYVEINVDVFPLREKELIRRTGTSIVPQVFFNEKLIGGLVVLNSLRNGGMLEKKMEEILSAKCPESAPKSAVYGVDDEEDGVDEMVAIVRVLRQKLPIQDRLTRMKLAKNCFSGADLVEHLDCARKKAVTIGKELARRHFIHHVFHENEFEDGNHFYRFLEHEPFIPKCYNFRGSVNDVEPKDASILSQTLSKLMTAILESYASDDRHHVNYVGISNSEEFRRYLSLVQCFQRVDLSTLSVNEKLAFFLNLYNAMIIHAVIRIGHPGDSMDRRRTFFSDFLYIIGGYPYSLSTVKNGILRGNRRAPFSLMKPLSSGDKRLELAFPKVNLLIHFALCHASKSSPAVKFFTHQNVESDLRHVAREYFQREDALQVDLAKRTVYLTRIIKWYSMDFGRDNDILKWLINYVDSTKAGLLTHLLGDGGSINIVYQNFDWSLNS